MTRCVPIASSDRSSFIDSSLRAPPVCPSRSPNAMTTRAPLAVLLHALALLPAVSPFALCSVPLRLDSSASISLPRPISLLMSAAAAALLCCATSDAWRPHGRLVRPRRFLAPPRALSSLSASARSGAVLFNLGPALFPHANTLQPLPLCAVIASVAACALLSFGLFPWRTWTALSEPSQWNVISFGKYSSSLRRM